jgi:ribosomal protein S18 acetylase RimI-like enzyme
VTCPPTPARDEEHHRIGELLALYVDPRSWRRGLGRRLMVEARRQLVDRGFAEALLRVLAGNHRAERFYRVDGWVADGDIDRQRSGA